MILINIKKYQYITIVLSIQLLAAETAVKPLLAKLPKFFIGFFLTVRSRLWLYLLLVFNSHTFTFHSILCIFLDSARRTTSFYTINYFVFPSLWRLSTTVFWTFVPSAVFPKIV